MFDKNQSRIIVILGLLGAFGCFFSFFALSQIPTLDFKFPLEKNNIFKKADSFLNLQGISSQPLIKKSKISSNHQGIIYLQKTLGIEKTAKLLDSLPLYFWQIDYVYPRHRKVILPLITSKQVTSVFVNPINAKIIGFSRRFSTEKYKHSPILSRNESEVIAKDFFSSTGFDISGFKMTRYSPIEGVYVFEWEKIIPELKIAKLKVKLEIFGDKVGNFFYFLEIPPTEFKKIQSSAFPTFLVSIILNLLVIALGIFVIIVSVINRKRLEWKFGLFFALLMSLSFLINFLKIGDYRGIYLIEFLFVFILSCTIYFFWTMIASCVAKLFAKESELNVFPINISSSIILSYIFFFSGLGFTLLFFIFVAKIFNPVATIGFDSFFSQFPSSRISCLIAPLLSLSAAVSEELFFRALMISFLNKYLKKMFWAIVLSSLVWSFIHMAPIAYSDVYPSFIKGIILLPIGILFGYIFIKFGLFCSIVTHYLHDLVVIGLAFLEFSNFRYANENIIAMLIAAILPLAIVFFLKIKESNV